jgi:hypothetical protein
MRMFICTFTNLNTNTCDQNKLILKIFVSYLQLLIMNISFVSMTCISHCQACFSKVFQLLLKKSLFTWTYIYPPEEYVPLQCQEFHGLLFLCQKRHRGRVMKFMLYIFYSLLTTYTYLCTVH